MEIHRSVMPTRRRKKKEKGIKKVVLVEDRRLLDGCCYYFFFVLSCSSSAPSIERFESNHQEILSAAREGYIFVPVINVLPMRVWVI